MPMSEYLRELRAEVGPRLLLLPTVAVLPRNDEGAVLLVRHADTGEWATIGGMVEPDEDPEDAARREAREEAGVSVLLRGVLAVLGGPDYRIRYPNGDEVACVPTVYAASVRSGQPRPDGDETDAVEWFSPDDLAGLPMGALNRALLRRVGLLL